MPKAAIRNLQGTTNVRFSREPFTHDLYDELKPLLEMHYQEIAHYKDIPLDVDVETYLRMEEFGTFRAYVARDYDLPFRAGESKIVGYIAFFVPHTNMHYKAYKMAVQDVVYVDTDYRGTGVAVGLMKFAEKALAEEGVRIVTQHMKAKHSFGPMLEKMGYELVDLIYSKRLDRGR